MPNVKMSLEDVATMPARTSTKTEQWIEFLKAIPDGKTWNFSKDFPNVKPATIKQAVKRLVKLQKVSTDLVAKQHNSGTKDKPVLTIYILHKKKENKD